MYREVLQLHLPWLDEVTAAKSQRRLPVVLTPSEVRALLNELNGTMGLLASLLYGTGMRVLEGLRLRVKDPALNDARSWCVTARAARTVSPLPENLILPRQQLAHAMALHDKDLQAAFGEVWLPNALSVKYPGAPRLWGWQWVFPSAVRSADPRTGVIRRHHLNEATCKGDVRGRAARRH